MKSPAVPPALGRALLIPALLAAALGALLFRPRAAAAPQTRPALATPIVLDELVPVTAAAQSAAPAQATQTPEGLRSLRAE